uniref:Uncharacterized protein n=1 Tax=Romanomermis culicivorax TaxID=13658 RepID=A0A915J2A6_ROMCU
MQWDVPNYHPQFRSKRHLFQIATWNSPYRGERAGGRNQPSGSGGGGPPHLGEICNKCFDLIQAVNMCNGDLLASPNGQSFASELGSDIILLEESSSPKSSIKVWQLPESCSEREKSMGTKEAWEGQDFRFMVAS